MAEFIFKDMISRQGIDDKFYVSSSATSTEEIWNGKGNPVYPPARDELLKHGISPSGKRAVQLKKEDYDKYDMFIGMDNANIRNMLRIFGADPENKISKLLEFAKRNDDVADPWYSNRFDIAYKDIFEGCASLLEEIKNRP
jgi:protein-tyrosine phosphatase